MISGIVFALGLGVVRSGRRRRRAARPASATSSSVCARASGQHLDCAAIEIARREIHLANALASRILSSTRLILSNEIGPIGIRDEPHARDDVAHRHVRGPLALLGMRTTASIEEPCARQSLGQAFQRGGGERVLVPEPLGELRGEALRERPGLARSDLGIQSRRRRPEASSWPVSVSALPC